MRLLIHSIGSAGHVLPLVSLGLAARAGGQDVLFAVEEQLATFPERAGFQTIALPTTSAAEDPRRAVEAIARRQALVGPARARAVQEMFVERSRSGMNTLSSVIDEYRPQVMLRDQAAYAAWALGAARDIPVACFSFFPRPLAGLRSLIDDLLAELLRSAGAPPDTPLEPSLHIVGGPPGWFPPEIFDSRTLMIQPPVDVGEDQDAIPDAVRDLPHPVVYVSIGTVGRETGFLRLVFDALLDAGATIVTTGAPPRQDLDRLHHHPWLPQLPLMEHVDAVVAHGGYGTIMTALTAGVPVLSIPQTMIDNRPNANRLAATGGGIALPPKDITPETSRIAVERLLSAELLAGARSVRDQIASLPGRDAAVTALAALHTGRRSQR